MKNLAIRNMLRKPAPKPDPDNPGKFLRNNAAAKAGLNRSIQDASWGTFIAILNAKAVSAGRCIIAVNPKYTSQTCFPCRHVSPDNRTTQDKFLCVKCGHSDNADTNAARNILRAGQVLQTHTA